MVGTYNPTLVVFSLLVVTLLVKPTGLFGKSVSEKV